jgi:hypothetical protein
MLPCHAMACWPPSCLTRHIPFPCRRFDSTPGGRIHTYIYRRRGRRRRRRNLSERWWSPRKATDRPTAGQPPIRAPAQLPVASITRDLLLLSLLVHERTAAACCVAAVQAAAAVVDRRRLVWDYSGRCCGFSCWPRHRRCCCCCDTKRRGGHVGNVIAGWSAAARARRGQGAAQVDAPAARPLRARRGPARRRRQ